jgi:hypothetical protein
MLGKDILEWLAKECVIFRLLPEGMVNPKERTEEQVHEIVEHWLEHGEPSIVGKRTVAQSRNTKTGQHDRDERNYPWMDGGHHAVEREDEHGEATGQDGGT